MAHSCYARWAWARQSALSRRSSPRASTPAAGCAGQCPTGIHGSRRRLCCTSGTSTPATQRQRTRRHVGRSDVDAAAQTPCPRSTHRLLLHFLKLEKEGLAVQCVAPTPHDLDDQDTALSPGECGLRRHEHTLRSRDIQRRDDVLLDSVRMGLHPHQLLRRDALDAVHDTSERRAAEHTITDRHSSARRGARRRRRRRATACACTRSRARARARNRSRSIRRRRLLGDAEVIFHCHARRGKDRQRSVQKAHPRHGGARHADARRRRCESTACKEKRKGDAPSPMAMHAWTCASMAALRVRHRRRSRRLSRRKRARGTPIAHADYTTTKRVEIHLPNDTKQIGHSMNSSAIVGIYFTRFVKST